MLMFYWNILDNFKIAYMAVHFVKINEDTISLRKFRVNLAKIATLNFLNLGTVHFFGPKLELYLKK